MFKALSNSFMPIVKWTSVAAISAAVVISIQANADARKTGEAHPSGVVSVLNTATVITATPIAATPIEAALVTPRENSMPWTPANGFADLIEDVSPAVVHVATAGFIERRRMNRRGGSNGRNFRGGPQGLEDFFNDFFGRRDQMDPRQSQPDLDEFEEQDDEQQLQDKQTRPLGIGSGFIISADGYVVTNHHVIDGADEIVVTLTDGTEYEAEIKGSDPKTDLALLKLKDVSGLPFLPWGDDERSRVGDWVLAIGNPFGLGGSASTGIISAIGRDIQAGPYDDFIQVDAAINRGNSGGPLFNMQGQVIGINSMIYSPSGGSVGIGFAIPASLAKGVIGQLQKTGQVERSWIGVSIGSVSKELAKLLDRPNEEGALVSGVMKDSPAAKAGLEARDIVLEFNGEPIKEMRNLPKEVAQSQVGKSYGMKVWRDGKVKTIKIKTEPFPSDDDDIASEEPKEQAEPQGNKILGVEMSKLTEDNRAEYRIAESVVGMLLTSVERRGLAARNNLRPGDVIVQFGSDKDIRSPEQITKILKAAKKAKQSSVAVLINRRGSPGFLVFKLD
ncbi:MAG: Do family serine endopeptidase [Arenicella sp.]|nr:Do family serine endopeptidase [Arenicella sp.]